jgi:hypothetical protein
MKRSLSHGTLIVLAAVSLIFQFPRIAFSRDSATKLELTLLVYNYTALSSNQITEIRTRVTFIFEHAGIRTNWLDCRPVPEDQSVPAACLQPLGPSNLAIRLLDRPISKAGSRTASLGHSFASGNGGWYGSVFCATVKDLARGDRDSEISLLGHAVAHEIGHLLLGPGAHNNEGIMKAQWNEGELQQIAAAQQGLLFSKEQAKRLRICLSARLKEAEDQRVADLRSQH